MAHAPHVVGATRLAWTRFIRLELAENRELSMTARNKLLYVAFGLALGFVVGFPLGRGSAPEASSALTPGSLTLEGRALKGPEDAPVTVVEFTDYECGFCKRHFERVYPVLVSRYGDRVNYTVRHMPATFIHKRAHRAAQAAECAADQDKFFEYHEILFENSFALSDRDLLRYATRVGADAKKLEACLESGVKSDLVDDDVQAAQMQGVRGTPTFFINGRVLIGAQPLEVFERYIERALRAD